MSDSVQPPEGLPGEQKITLTHRMLGLRPYVLVEYFDGGEGDDDLRASIEAGAGIWSVDDIRSALEMALAHLPESDGPPVAAAPEGLLASTGEVAPPAGAEINPTET
jgi:hypothetical protein